MYDIHFLLSKAAEKKASDLHITVDSPPVLRINGTLIQEGEQFLTTEDTERMARQIVTEKEWQRFESAGELDFSYEIEQETRFRVNMYRQKKHLGLVFRVIPKKIPSLETLNMPEILQDIALKPHGLFLVTGPTGSGKSTTLAAMVNKINEHTAKHIITLEDPIEYEHIHKKSIINQREIGSDTEGFKTGLRSALRQDPDVILVGEMRDHETISTAITAAETGHLVLATLHTSSAIQTINRIIDVFPPHQQGQIRTQLSMVLVGVLSQRLIPRLDGTGRVAATEVLVNMPSVANLIRNEKVEQIPNVLVTSRSAGMHPLQVSINELALNGQIDRDYFKASTAGAGDYA